MLLVLTDELVRIKKNLYRCFEMYTMLCKVNLILSFIPLKGCLAEIKNEILVHRLLLSIKVYQLILRNAILIATQRRG